MASSRRWGLTTPRCRSAGCACGLGLTSWPSREKPSPARRRPAGAREPRRHPAGPRPAARGRGAAGPAPSAPLPAAPPLEIDLRGRLVDEALDELERHLDAAYLAGTPFLRIIHGKGTGRLREGIRQALRGNPYVRSFEAGTDGEGGGGVTFVRLGTN